MIKKILCLLVFSSASSCLGAFSDKIIEFSLNKQERVFIEKIAIDLQQKNISYAAVVAIMKNFMLQEANVIQWPLSLSLEIVGDVFGVAFLVALVVAIKCCLQSQESDPDLEQGVIRIE